MKALLRHVDGKLHRKLFFGFGATIFVTFVVLGLVMHGLSSSLPPPWEQEWRRVGALVSGEFVEVWDRPRAREALAEHIAEQLKLQVEVFDLGGAALSRHGEPCHSRTWQVDVQDRGMVRFCMPHRTASGSARFALALGILGLVVWLGSGLLARRITRPLGVLARITKDIGAGRLEARAVAPGHDELGDLAHAINEMAGRIQAQMNDQRTLLAAVSHELRTPLGHLRLLVELAQTEDLPEAERARALAEIDQEVQEMDNLVGELLANSRLEFSSLQLQVIDAEQLGRRALARAGLDEAKLTVEPGLPEVMGDATLIARALANLIRNAQTHGAGLQRLVVRARDEGIALEVEDGGPGIAPEDREHIFRPFHRVGTQKGSLGLGLALVSRIAEVHDGRAYAGPGPKGGAAVGFTVRLRPGGRQV